MVRELKYNISALSMRKAKISREVSIFVTPASAPFPKSWPLSQKGWSYVRSEGAGPTPGGSTSRSGDTLQHGANLPTLGHSSKGKGREDVGREGDGDGGESGSSFTGGNDIDEGAGANSGVGVNVDTDDERDREDHDQDNDDDDDMTPSSTAGVDPKSPRRSNRERKVRPISPDPSSNPGKPRGPKARRSRKRPREPPNGEDGQYEIDEVPAIRQVHSKGVKQRQAIIEESVVKMEGVEVRRACDPAVSVIDAHIPSLSPH